MHPRTKTTRPLHTTPARAARRFGLVAACAALLAGSASCAPNLLAVGYAAPNKVWYHWLHDDGRQTVVVCDVAPNGREDNCRESQL
ncbi:MAG: hypothetical protein KF850_37390 [Labilithrix sp.]|nr:hypothetical protein [Labilithrix sp.]